MIPQLAHPSRGDVVNAVFISMIYFLVLSMISSQFIAEKIIEPLLKSKKLSNTADWFKVILANSFKVSARPQYVQGGDALQHLSRGIPSGNQDKGMAAVDEGATLSDD